MNKITIEQFNEDSETGFKVTAEESGASLDAVLYGMRQVLLGLGYSYERVNKALGV